MIPQIQPMETLGMLDALDFQELRSPTEIHLIKYSEYGQRSENIPVRRRVLDIQLWRNLSVEQQHAAERIERAFKMICAGLGAKGQTFGEALGGRSLKNTGDHLLTAYVAWTKECARLGLPVKLALGILVEGRTIVSYAAERRCRRAIVKQLFEQLLDAYCAVNRVPDK